MPIRVQDIVPGDRRSVRDLKIEKKRVAEEKNRPSSHSKRQDDDAPKAKRGEEAESHIRIHKAEESAFKRMSVTPPVEESRPKKSKKKTKLLLITFGIIIVVAGIAFFASTQYSRASFTIVPKTISISTDGTYVAQGTAGAGALTYEIVTIKALASTTVPAVDGPQTSTKAQGTVTVYNAFSDQPVRLIAGTRLANDSGLVYNLTSSIVIPGYKKSAQGTLVPGSINAAVIASQPGAEYNLGKADPLSDFKFLGYKGTPRYDVVYARLAKDIVGGYVGTKKNISAASMASTTAKLKTSLTNLLTGKLKNSVPAEYILFDNGYVVTFTEPKMEGAEKKTAVVSQQGTIHGILLKRKDLVSKLTSGQSDSVFSKFGYMTPDLGSIQFSYTNIKDFSPDKKSSLAFKSKGTLKLVGLVPVEEIRQKMQGASLASTQDIFKSYSAVIKTGSGELAPPWAKIPNDPKRITISVKED